MGSAFREQPDPSLHHQGRCLRIILRPMSSTDDPHRAYPIVASEPNVPARSVRELLSQLLPALGMKGAYSVVVSRQQGLALPCVFELKEDADRVATAVGAKPERQV